MMPTATGNAFLYEWLPNVWCLTQNLTLLVGSTQAMDVAQLQMDSFLLGDLKLQGYFAYMASNLEMLAFECWIFERLPS